MVRFALCETARTFVAHIVLVRKALAEHRPKREREGKR